MATPIIKGRARKFGDNIDTDSIAPGPFLYLPMDEMKTHAFSPIKPDFHKTVQKGDIIVAGHNFGCGSSREQAAGVVKALGVRYIVCESMGRIYFRNCIALGVYPVMAQGASGIFDEGDDIEIDIDAGRVTNRKTGQSAFFKPLTGTPREILDGGGIIPSLKKITEKK